MSKVGGRWVKQDGVTVQTNGSDQLISVLNAANLTNVYSHAQMFIPASAMHVVTGATITTYTSTGTGTFPPVYTVAKMPTAVKSELMWQWGFKADFAANPAASLSLKMTPLYYSDSANGSSQVVRFQHGVINFNLGKSMNANENTETTMDSTPDATAYELSAGITANGEAALVTTFEGDAISAGNWNFLAINFEREGADAADTFTGDVYLLGVGMQWVTNFGNIAVWPVS